VSDTLIGLVALGTRELPDFLHEIPTVDTRCRSLSWGATALIRAAHRCFRDELTVQARRLGYL
jgi:hypothetical protein